MSQFCTPYSNKGNRPSSLDTYDSMAPEHAVISSLNEEWVNINSPDILYFKFDYEATVLNTTELGELYGETDNERSYVITPIAIKGMVERSPIMQELARSGLTTTDEINFLVDIESFVRQIGREPQGGDLFRVSSIIQTDIDKHRFYEVSSAVEVDMNLNRYINYMINAEQTALEKVPAEIKNYLSAAG